MQPCITGRGYTKFGARKDQDLEDLIAAVAQAPSADNDLRFTPATRCENACGSGSGVANRCSVLEVLQ